jgi:hypothetical protein
VSNLIKLFEDPIDQMADLIKDWRPESLVLVGISDGVFNIYHTPFDRTELLGVLEMAKHELLHIGEE